MARIPSDQTLRSSFLDRLLKPADGSASPRSEGQLLAEMKLSVQWDLTNLLNTRWRCSTWPPRRSSERTALNEHWREDVKELENSLANYGVPDITGQSLGAGIDPGSFARVLEWSLRTYEPRLKNVKVTASMSTDAADRSMRFRIKGVLNVHPLTESVIYDTALEPSTGHLTVERANR